mmetsp:Transcript_45700/g.130444  ORF Transcript_45700/g.130444 Transcript_45700/m.130444 type:complete len:356 (-) Transcript_45700:120-1187(-)
MLKLSRTKCTVTVIATVSLSIRTSQSARVQPFHTGPYNTLRPDKDIFERTAAVAQGANISGPVYPLIVSIIPSSHLKYAKVAPKKIPHENVVNPCANVGLTVAGFMSTAGNTHARYRHRSIQTHVKVPCFKFVYVIGGRGLKDMMVLQLEEESKLYGDIVMLPIAENMNEGKSHEWFKFAQKEYPSATYIAKGDLDALIHPAHLAQQLMSLPSDNLLYGFDCSHNKLFKHATQLLSVSFVDDLSDSRFMCGMFYLFSRGLLECIGKSQRVTTRGAEDQVASKWPFEASCPLNHAGDMYRFFDYRGHEAHALWGQELGWNSDFVCIHQLKTDQAWQAVGEMLCATANMCEPVDLLH